MKKNVLPLAAALVLFCGVPFFAAAQTTEEQIETGRFGTEEPIAAETGGGDNIHNNRWLFLGLRLGPSLRFYTPSGDTAFTGGDTYGPSLEAGLLADVRIVPLFSIQAEAVFTWDKASVWEYTLNAAGDDLDRYTRTFQGFSLQFPLIAKLNFYPGKFRISPFFGSYFVLPLGQMETGSPYDADESFNYSVSPPFGLLGGFSIAYPLGPGMIFADLRYAADLGKPDLRDSGGMETYRRHMVSMSMGFEFGFFQKRQRGSSK
jgi:hypothetical protein